VLLHDVTERLRSEQQRRDLETQVQHAQKLDALGRLSGGVAHDFNNLLTIILINTELARSADDDATVDERLARVEKAGLRAVDLVTQLLAFSRTPQVEMNPIDTGAVLADMTGVIRETFDRRIEIQIRIDQTLLPVLGNKDQMNQVLLNLCINARDAVLLKSWEGSPDRPSITVGAEVVAVTQEYCRKNLEASPGDYVRICVSDNGVGMDAETQRQIFDPFFTTKDVGKGTGLGLAIVYGIVRQHEGWVDVVSAPNAGAAFYVYLPAMTAAEPDREALDAETLPPRGTGTVLLVDDEELILDAGKAMLNDLGYTPLIAPNGNEALRIFEQEHHRIVATILDLSMPQMSGYDVLRELRRIDPEARVVVASGYSPAGLARPLEALGASAFVAKPFQVGDMARALRDVIEGP
jgi:nitrogen-specific signal transduction histidine kinase/CheY-like chemotaxis protein